MVENDVEALVVRAYVSRSDAWLVLVSLVFRGDHVDAQPATVPWKLLRCRKTACARATASECLRA